MGIVLVNSVFMYEKGRWTYLFFQIIIVLYFYDYKYRVIPKQILSFTLLVQNQFSDHFLRIFADFGSYLLNIFSQKYYFWTQTCQSWCRAWLRCMEASNFPLPLVSLLLVSVSSVSRICKKIFIKRGSISISWGIVKLVKKNEKHFMFYINRSWYHNTTHSDNHVKKCRHQIKNKVGFCTHISLT